MTQRLKCSGIGHGIEAQLGPWLRRLRAPEARRAGRASSASMYLHDIAPMRPLPRVHTRSHNTAGEPSLSVKRMRRLSTLVRFLSVGFLSLRVEATRSTLHRKGPLQPMRRCAMVGRGPRVIRPAPAMASQITNRLMRGCIAPSGHIPYIACSSGRSSLTQWVARKPCEVDGAWHSGRLRVILVGGGLVGANASKLPSIAAGAACASDGLGGRLALFHALRPKRCQLALPRRLLSRVSIIGLLFQSR